MQISNNILRQRNLIGIVFDQGYKKTSIFILHDNCDEKALRNLVIYSNDEFIK